MDHTGDLLSIRLQNKQFITSYKVASSYLRTHISSPEDSLTHIAFTYNPVASLLVRPISEKHMFYPGAFTHFSSSLSTTYVLTRDPLKRLLTGIVQAALIRTGPNDMFRNIPGIPQEFYDHVRLYLDLPAKDLIPYEKLYTGDTKHYMLLFFDTVIKEYMSYVLKDIHCSEYHKHLYMYINHINTGEFYIVDIDKNPLSLNMILSAKPTSVKQSNKVFLPCVQEVYDNLPTTHRVYQLIQKFCDQENSFKQKVLSLQSI